MSESPEADAALLRAIESDLAHYHRQRMAQRQGGLAEQLRVKRGKPNPDPDAIAVLEAAMVQAERDKHDVSITEREVLEPLRERIRRRASVANRNEPPEADMEV